MKKYLLLLITMLLCSSKLVFAQNITVKGIVTDAATKEKLIGVTVSVKGTSHGTATDANGQFQAMLMTAPSMRIAGGTDEILRNIIAERVLGLPGDIRVDKDVPFNKVPTKGR